MTSPAIPVFLNGRLIPVAAGTTLALLLSEHAPELARAMLGGTILATDGRGLPVRPEDVLASGAILRVRESARGGEDV